MNVFHSCDGTDILIRRKTKCSIQFGFASLNRTFNLSPHENICTTSRITIHYLYDIYSSEPVVTMYNILMEAVIYSYTVYKLIRTRRPLGLIQSWCISMEAVIQRVDRCNIRVISSPRRMLLL